MFEKTLTDVVKGIRASKRDTVLYISQCLAEIKQELQSADMFVKANALQKLTFLQMMGYHMSFASFATIEVMSSPRFAHKRIGYLAASQGALKAKDDDVDGMILLTTNLLQKELRGASGTSQTAVASSPTAASGSSSSVYEAGLAINCISNIVTPDLAADLLPELTQLTSHPEPHLRKKAVLCLFKLFCQYPHSLRLTFARLQSCLQDPHPAVVSSAVNVITELADAHPRQYLPLAPAFFELLTGSSNNWMLIKVVKLLGRLVSEEPRLARKLLEPLARIVQTTQAKSLLYEAVYTITLCLPHVRKADGSVPAIVPEIVQLSASTLRQLVQESDQNLKYLGLVGLASLRQSHPRVLLLPMTTTTAANEPTAPSLRHLILQCLSDPDVTIRTRALSLLPGLATRKNLVDLVSQLLQHVQQAHGTRESSQYRHDLVAQIVHLCNHDKYALLLGGSEAAGASDLFEWYLDVLLQLAQMRGVESHAATLHQEVNNVALRVLPVRTHAVQKAVELLLQQGGSDDAAAAEPSLLDGTTGAGANNNNNKHVVPELLPALAWIVGEYSDLLPAALPQVSLLEKNNTTAAGPYHALVQTLSSPWNVKPLPTATQAVYLQAVMKVAAAASQQLEGHDPQQLQQCWQTLHVNLPIYLQSVDVQVLECAMTALELLRALGLHGHGAVPDLTQIEDEDEDDSSEEEENQEADLLGDLVAGPSPTAAKVKKSKKKKTVSTTVNSDAAAAARTLNYLYKPSPMKPVGAKAQRKKRMAPLGLENTGIDLEAPLDLSPFESLLEQEVAYLNSAKLSMESVSFTQQRPMTTTTTTPTVTSPPAAEIGALSPMAASFQNPAAAQQHQQRQNDPFYLSSPTTKNDAAAGNTTDLMGGGEETKTASATGSPTSRFGTIQLPDDDYEGDPAAVVAPSHKLSKKEKKALKKAKKQQQQQQPPAVAAPAPTSGSADFLSFDPHSAPAPPTAPTSAAPAPPTVPSQPPPAPVATTIYDSDDDDSEEGAVPMRKTSIEMSKLSKVDLTAPLAEHEVMLPNRIHRGDTTAAAYAAAQQQQPAAPKSKKELKKERKEAKKNKKKQKQHGEAEPAAVVPAPTSGAAEGDLLDLFGAPAPPTQPAAAPTAPTGGDAIGTAFDDLLGLSTTPAPAPVLPSAAPAPGPADFAPIADPTAGGVDTASAAAPAPSRKASRPWIKAAVKSSQGTGSGIDFSQLQVSFRVYPRSSETATTAAMIVTRVENLTNAGDGAVALDWNSGNAALERGSTPGLYESAKIGPFAYPQADAAYEIKATLRWNQGAVPVKFTLPASLHLAPQPNLTLDQVAQGLSSEPFSSISVKVTLSATAGDMESVKQALCGFLRVAPVLEEVANPKAATFAALSSTTRAKVRVMAKIKDATTVKVDIRSTNANLGSALASDLKKVVL